MLAKWSFRPDIQGLRAISIILVVLFHYNDNLVPGGFVGVDAFLVISGFLITGILLERKADNKPVWQQLKLFYLSRFQRIAPAYLFMLVFVAIFSVLLLTPKDFSFFYASLRSALYFNSNNYFSSFGDYFAPSSYELPLLHTWSLAVEMQFYLLFPLIVICLPIRWLKVVTLGLIVALSSFSSYELYFLGETSSVYYSLYSRVPEFLLGSILSMFNLKGASSKKTNNIYVLVGLGLIFVSAFSYDSSTLFPGLFSLIPVLGAVLVIYGGKNSSVDLLSTKTAVWLGTLSYSIYLWHWPILALTRYYTGEEVLSFYASISFFSLTLLASCFSFYFIESAFSRKKEPGYSFQDKPRNIRTYFGVGALSFSVLVLAFYIPRLNQMLSPADLPVDYKRYADPSEICHGKMVGDCFRGELSSDKEVLVLGDSHAAMLNEFFDYLGKELHFKARVITASSCVTVHGFDTERLPSWAQTPCIQQINEAQKYVNSAKIIFLAGMWSYQLESDAFKDALVDFVRLTEEQNKNLFILTQVPELEKNPSRMLRFKQLGLPYSKSIIRDSSQEENYFSNLVSKHGNVEMVDFHDLPMFKQLPFFNGDIIYMDSSHLNEFGAKEYAKQAQLRISKIFRDLDVND